MLCEKIIVDQETLRPSLINVFESLAMPSFPWDLDEFFVFVQLSDGIGSYFVTLEVQDLATDNIVNRSASTSIDFFDRLQRLNLVIAIPSLHLLSPTTYDIVVFAEGEEIDRQRLVLLPEQEDNDDGQETD